MILANPDGAMAHEPVEVGCAPPSGKHRTGAFSRPAMKDAPCESVESATTLPLAMASQRLRGRPGRPRTKPSGDNPR